MVRICFLVLLTCCGCAGGGDTMTGVARAELTNRRASILPIVNPTGPTPEEYGVQILELSVTWRDSYTDTTQTPMDDEEFVARAAAIIREAQATGCADGIQ